MATLSLDSISPLFAFPETCRQTPHPIEELLPALSPSFYQFARKCGSPLFDHISRNSPPVVLAIASMAYRIFSFSPTDDLRPLSPCRISRPVLLTPSSPNSSQLLRASISESREEFLRSDLHADEKNSSDFYPSSPGISLPGPLFTTSRLRPVPLAAGFEPGSQSAFVRVHHHDVPKMSHTGESTVFHTAAAYAQPLTFEQFSELYEKVIIENSPIPEHLRSIDYFVEKGQPKKKGAASTSAKTEMRKKTLYASFLVERSTFFDPILRNCYALYRNSSALSQKSPSDGSEEMESNLLFPVIIGVGSTLKEEALLRNFGAISSGKSTLSDRLKDKIPTETTGGINHELKWNLTKNDFFMLGVMAANKPVYVNKFKGSIPLDCLWNEETQTPSVFFREMFFLIHCDYRLVVHPLTGIAFHPPCGGTGEKRLGDLYPRILSGIEKIRSKGDVSMFLSKHFIPFNSGTDEAPLSKA